MSMNAEKDITNRILVGHTSLGVGDDEPRVFGVYQLPSELPQNDKKREVCIDHIRHNVASELMSDFDMAGVHYPEADEPQAIITQLSCKGTSCILKKCGLKVEQFDSNGIKIGEMKANS